MSAAHCLGIHISVAFYQVKRDIHSGIHALVGNNYDTHDIIFPLHLRERRRQGQAVIRIAREQIIMDFHEDKST
jgi:hypothetical protein